MHSGPQLKRSQPKQKFKGPLVRLACGVEDPKDLISDLKQAFNAIS